MNELKIGEIIKNARIASGFKTKKEFADKTGLSPATLTRIERNTQRPTPETLMQMSKFLSTITYGELMEHAGYLEGLKEEHQDFVKDFMNENEELDNKVTSLLDKLSLFTNAQKDLNKKIASLLISDDILDLYTNADMNQLKNTYYQNDFSIEEKRNILKSLEVHNSEFSPKLEEYLKLAQIPRPIPLVGSICAGNGLIADENVEEYISYPLLKKQNPDFALRVKGDSMINAGINDGDIVFFRKESWAEFNGQIVAVVINGEEGVLKRLSWTEGSAKFTLSPENDSYQSVEVKPNELIVCGVYAGHFKPVD